jgi:plastocyanin
MFHRNLNSLLAGWLLAILPALGAGSAAAQWGDLKVNFKVDGKPPKLDDIGAAAAKGCPPKVPNETFVVDKAGNLKDVVVWLLPGDAEPKIHPGYAAAAAAKVTLSNKGCQFVPHVTLVRAGQTLVITNGDMAGHNSRYDFKANKLSENPLIPAMDKHTVAAITKSERLPWTVDCGIHPFMKGLVLIQTHPYMAVSDAAGDVTIKDLPAGKHTFMFWQENTGYIPPNGKLKTLKGKAEIEIEDGKVKDLGTVLVKYNTR